MTTDDINSLVDKQSNALYRALHRIKELEAEVSHLKELLNGAAPIINMGFVQSSEDVVIETQLDILKNRALQKELSLEEIKIFDTLVKNKNLLASKDKPLEVKKSDVPEAELVYLASRPKKE